MSGHVFAFGPFVMDLDRGTLVRDGLPMAVGSRAAALLGELLKANNRVVGKAILLDAAWPGRAVEESNLSVQIASLRKLLGPSTAGGEWIATVAGTGYRFTGKVVAAKPDQTGGQVDYAMRPIIVVLPFTNVTGNGATDHLAEGITEGIVAALARFRWFAVVSWKGFAKSDANEAPKSAVRYILQGSARKSNGRIRISAQLIEAPTGAHIWAEKFEPDSIDPFAVQDQIAEWIAGAIEPELLKAEATFVASHASGELGAMDLVRRGTWCFHQVTRATHLEARELFRQACRLDPRLPEAHVWRARVSAGILAYGWTDNPSTDLREGLEAAVAAIHLDERSPYAHYGLAIISIYGGDLEQAIRAGEKAVELSTSFALGHLVLGMARLFSGNAPDAVGPLERGLRLNRYDPQNFVWFNLLALAHLFAGHADRALDSALRVLQIRPDWRPGFEAVVCCQMALGNLEKARKFAAQTVELNPATGDVLSPLKSRNPSWERDIANMLREAGVSA